MRGKTFVWMLAWGAVGLAAAFFISLRSFRVFSQEELVATVRCEALSRRESSGFVLVFTPLVQGIPGTPRRFSLQGDQWTLGGDILKWRRWVNLLGLRNCHRLTRVSSRYLKASSETAQPPSAYDLNGGTSAFWLWLYRWGVTLPFVEAVYGNAAYTLAQPGSQWGVYVTYSGYLIKPIRHKS